MIIMMPFFDDDETVGRELVPLKGQELETVRKNHGKSLVTTNMYYKPKSITQSLLEEEEEAADIVTSETNSELARLEEEYNLDLAEKGQLKVPGVKKVEIPALTDVGPIVNDSEVLQKLVQLGVDLSVVQKKGMIEDVLKMNFKKDVGPYIWTLKDIGVPADKLGEVFTRCPWIFQQDVNKLRVRIDYLRSKKFTKSDIENMIDKDPKFLLIPVEKVDAKLGFLQQEFRLTGKQVREKVSGLSKLIIAKPAVIKESKFYMKKFLGFTDRELKTIFLAYPKIFLKNVDHTSNAFNYLHNVMELPHELIAKTPIAMDTTRYFLENRHRFLVKCGRAQYDPTKPNYVSLHALLTAKEDIWCVEIAKASVAEYNQFLRTI
ncbi:transcription termination factor 3, mitochondrial-like [Mercenaria mercenaria]|uniref:transcription termination factor 3, mitochondrial-like n=1 Tax=Mercenaria mercenaria TaxID=6596 RepID=UPI00234EF7C3|nr:transcription termination factor 3, mitochondrial-like [Mercenaria mercenaria]